MREEGSRHDRCAAFLRNREEAVRLMKDTGDAFRRLFSVRVRDFRALLALLIRADTLAARYAMLSAIDAYIGDGGLSRGSFLVEGAEGLGLDARHAASVLETRLIPREDGGLDADNRFVPVRPIPQADNWFENVYNAYDGGERFGPDPAEKARAEGGNA